MASNFFKNVAKMQVVGALGLYLQTFVQNSSKVLVVCRTNTKKAPRKVPFDDISIKQRYLA
ncbi:hypothetical protein F2P58_03145 [Vibrio fortis]|jgi:hypothetical protein|uniref:Uncharacterized protein n=1 Tax=Vibrio fortis TaxID=212667 RepID=A0A5N3R635_9VIBR|nr:hypothetical protein F2P58_03145 [Vibrio fortis]